MLLATHSILFDKLDPMAQKNLLNSFVIRDGSFVTEPIALRESGGSLLDLQGSRASIISHIFLGLALFSSTFDRKYFFFQRNLIFVSIFE